MQLSLCRNDIVLHSCYGRGSLSILLLEANRRLNCYFYTENLSLLCAKSVHTF